MSKADILLKKAILFEKMAQDVLPLTDLPGAQLQADPDTGRGYYQNTAPAPTKSKGIPQASLSGPSSVSAPAQAPAAPAAPAAPVQNRPAPKKPQNVPPEWLKKYMELEQSKEWALGEIERLKAEMEEMKKTKGTPAA